MKITYELLTVGILTAWSLSACGAGEELPGAHAGSATVSEEELATMEADPEGNLYITRRIHVTEEERIALELEEPHFDARVLVDGEGNDLTPIAIPYEAEADHDGPLSLSNHGGGAIWYYDGLVIPPSGRHYPSRINGDQEFNGTPTQQPEWEVQAWLYRTGATVYGKIYMHAWEDDGDNSEGETTAGGTPYALLNSPGNHNISQLQVGSSGWLPGSTNFSESKSGRDTNGYSVQTVAGTTDLVSNFKVYGDRSGDDLGVYTGVVANLNRVHINAP